MPRKIKTGSPATPGTHVAYNNDFEYVGQYGGVGGGAVTITDDIPGSTVDEAHFLIMAVSGTRSEATHGNWLQGVADDQPKPDTRRCYVCYDEDWHLTLMQVESPSPGTDPSAADSAPWADTAYRLLTRPMPAGTIITPTFQANGGSNDYSRVFHFKGGKTSFGGIGFGTIDPITPSGFTGFAGLTDVPGFDPIYGGFILVAALSEGLGGAANCDSGAILGWHAGPTGVGGGVLSQIALDTTPSAGGYTGTEWPLSPPCIPTIYGYANHCQWQWGIAPSDHLDLGYVGGDASSGGVWMKVGGMIADAAPRGPQCCSVGIKVAQHHHAPNT